MGKSDKLKIEHINAQSLLSYLVSETWLTKDVLDQHIALPNFNVYKRDKVELVVYIYVRNICTVSVIGVNIDQVEEIEDWWLTVQHRKLPSITCGCMCRHPHANLHTFDYILDVLIIHI